MLRHVLHSVRVQPETNVNLPSHPHPTSALLVSTLLHFPSPASHLLFSPACDICPPFPQVILVVRPQVRTSPVSHVLGFAVV